MNFINKISRRLKKKRSPRLLSSTEAYKLWSTFYDNQPDNVVLYLEEKLFSEMISLMKLDNKNILDIGCGTGRHWERLLSCNPSMLLGVDTSTEMLEKLKEKFPLAEVFVPENYSLKNLEDGSFDLIISTLTIGHIKEIGKYFEEWDRVLKSNCEIIITDFHPDASSVGMKRTFIYNEEVIEAENNLYTVAYLNTLFDRLNWEIISVNEKRIDDEVRHLFEKQNHIDSFNKYHGTPLILGLHLIKR